MVKNMNFKGELVMLTVEEVKNRIAHCYSMEGIRWSKEMSNFVRNILDDYLSKNNHTKEENDIYSVIMNFFATHDTSIDIFASWEDYVCFCETYCEDFFGIN